MTENGFNYIIDQHRNKDVWKRNELWEWQGTEPNFNLNLTSTMIDESRLEIADTNNEFILTKVKQSSDHKGKYILIGKGVS
jgi:hypothetical protein